MARNEAVFYALKCKKNKKDFYARYDYAYDGVWVLTYGLVDIPEEENSGSSWSLNRKKSTIDISTARTGPQYKCPYCGSKGYVRCGNCGKLTCYDYSGTFSCAHCGNAGSVSGQIRNLDGDRRSSQK